MKRTTIMLWVLGLGLTFVRILPVLAQEGPEAVQTITVSGSLIAIDTENSTITVQVSTDEQGLQDKVFIINDATVIDKNGEDLALSDLVVNSQITVEYFLNDNGDLMAQYIWVE